MPQWLIDLIDKTDWVNVGTYIVSILSLVLGWMVWFKKNVANIAALKEEAGDLGEMFKYFKALIRNNKNLMVELSNLKIEINNLRKEIRSLKSEQKETTDGVHK